MKPLLSVLIICTLSFCYAKAGCPVDTIYPFSVDSSHITIWNESEYIPFFIKGCNFGVTLPGKYPGDLAVSRAQYSTWFSLLKDAGFNCIRLYTLHFPDFYEVLDSFNLANPKNPLYFIQGIWLEEELPNYANDIYFLDLAFTTETEEDVDCVHGSRFILPRVGKAYGSYSTDVSRWNMGYIMGRELAPAEVITTNQAHLTDSVYAGQYFSIKGNPTETFISHHLDELDNYEYLNYHTQRPVCFSNWPTLDPLSHPYESNRWEDSVSIDLSNIDFHNAPAGFFVSFHAYPYYPDFISLDSTYLNYSDTYGPNSYLGYLTALRAHYHGIPLIIAETGTPSSWGVAHYSSSGMNHGGMNEQKQGENMLRIFENARTADCGGAINFSIIDEWFKRTWITDPIDFDPARRILWHNIMAAEQNFGLVKFEAPLNMQNWETFNQSKPVKEIKANAGYDFFQIGLSIDTFTATDEMWIGIDTYRADSGESVLPSGDTIQNRAEFALHITNYSVQLFVTQAYDIFRIWQGTSDSTQLYHSIVSDGAPWVIERWENNTFTNQIQYIGNLTVNNGSTPATSLDAVTIFKDSIQIRLPWSLLEYTDPSSMKVLNDYRSTPVTEDTVSDGIQVSVVYHDSIAVPSTRFTWSTWDSVPALPQVLKTSYFIVKAGLPGMNNPAIAVADYYSPVDSFPYIVSSQNGVLSNDFDLDGNILQAVLVSNPSHGSVSLNSNGSFSYSGNAGYSGADSFEYCLFDGIALSKPNTVCLDVSNVSLTPSLDENFQLSIFPNPVCNELCVKSSDIISEVYLLNSEGKLLFKTTADNSVFTLDVTSLNAGNYFMAVRENEKTILQKFCIIH